MLFFCQHEFVRYCQSLYEQMRLEPGNPMHGDWQEAHYPTPKCLGGTEVIWLLREHHAVQGVLQSLEYGVAAVFGWEKAHLKGEWAYLLPHFIHVCGERSRKNNAAIHSEKTEGGKSALGVENAERLNREKTPDGKSVNAVKGGQQSGKNGKGALCRTPEEMTAHGREGGNISKSQSLGIFAPGQQSNGGRSAAKQRWQCTKTGKVSAAGPLTGWQKARGIDPANRVRRLDLEQQDG